jgi:hypothetical protein
MTPSHQDGLPSEAKSASESAEKTDVFPSPDSGIPAAERDELTRLLKRVVATGVCALVAVVAFEIPAERDWQLAILAISIMLAGVMGIMVYGSVIQFRQIRSLKESYRRDNEVLRQLKEGNIRWRVSPKDTSPTKAIPQS